MTTNFYRISISLSILLLLGASSFEAFGQQRVPSPEEYLGFEVGADRKLARWDQILGYIGQVDEAFDRVGMEVVGETTSGNPFVVVVVSSPENMRQLERYEDIAAQLASGRLEADDARDLAASGKVIVFLNHNVHSTEIASSQTTLRLLHFLSTDTSEEVREILDKVILVHLPSGNPDGQIMAVDWYRQNVGTEYEQSPMPWLYHPYIGHDNNRDFFMGNVVESALMMQLVYKDWHPQIYLDQHQMGAFGARMFVPPFPDPPNEHVDPLIWQQIKFLGGGIATDLQVAGKQGVLTNAMYRIYHQGGPLSVWWHNIVGLLTETASASMATPLTLDREDLRPTRPDQGLPVYETAKNFPDPWYGGEWHLSDIVDHQFIAAMSVLKQAARYKSEFLFNNYLMAQRAIEAAEVEGPFAYVVPAGQKDGPTADEMIERLMLQGIEVHRADSNVQVGGETYLEGSFFLLAAQPARSALVDLFESQDYPDVRLYPEGPPILPYDVTGYTLPMQMGVTYAAIEAGFDVSNLRLISSVENDTVAPVPAATETFVLNHEINKTAVLVNRLLARDVPVYRVPQAIDFNGTPISSGAFAVPASAQVRTTLMDLNADLSLPIGADPSDFDVNDSGLPLNEPRVGLYRSWVPSIDEGWTRWILEEFDFAYVGLQNEAVRNGNLRDDYDVIILPAQLSLRQLVEGRRPGEIPEPYVGGIGEEGIENLKRFVVDGGTLIALDSGGEVVLEHFDVPLTDALDDVSTDQFYCPGCIVRLGIDTDHPIGFGLEPEVAAKFANSPGYVVDTESSNDVRVLASYPSDGPLLMSGLIIGEEVLQDKAAVVQIGYGSGSIIMLGFRVQHRGQTHGTYKLLFNSIYDGGSSSLALESD